MTPFTEYVLNNCLHIGSFTLKNSQMVFTSNFRSKDLVKFGDVIYYFVYKKKCVLKVGKSINFDSRQRTYCRDNQDQTTIMILRKAIDHNIDEVEVYIEQVPRIQSEIVSKFTTTVYTQMISQLHEYEHNYIAEAEATGDTLIFNTQKKKK